VNIVSVTDNVLTGLRRTAQHELTVGAAVTASAQYVVAAIGFITGVVMARLLGPKDYGLAAVITSYPLLAGSVVVIKSGSVTTRYISGFLASREMGKLGSVCKLGYWLDFLLSVLAFLVVALTGWWVAREFFNMPDVAWLMTAYAACFPLWSLFGTSNAILTSCQRFSWLAALQILNEGIRSILVIGLVLGGFGVPGMVLGAAAGNIIIGLIAVSAAAYALHHERVGCWWKASLRQVVPLRKEMAGYFGWNSVMVTCAGLTAQVPLMLLGRFRGPEEAGFYRLATSIVAAGSHLETAMGKVAYPVLSARWGVGKRDHIERELNRWTLCGGLPVGVIVLLTIPFLPIIIPMVFGSHYSLMASGVQIMMLGNAASATFFWLNPFYYAFGKLNIWTISSALHTFFVVGLAWLFIAQLGFWGMALLVSAGKAGFVLSMVIIFRKFTANQ
jgi:O-antigen/teichoic acid export membrane protein